MSRFLDITKFLDILKSLDFRMFSECFCSITLFDNIFRHYKDLDHVFLDIIICYTPRHCVSIKSIHLCKKKSDITQRATRQFAS